MDDYTKITPECYVLLIGISGDSRTFNFSRYKSGAGSANVFISTSSDTSTIELVSGCILSVGHGGIQKISETTGTYISYTINGFDLTISINPGFPFGVSAGIRVFFTNSYYKTTWP